MAKYLSSKILFIFLLILCSPINVTGFSYERFSNGSFTSIHVLVVDPKQHVILPVRAAGRETVLNLANRHGATAAINGGFWKANGMPAGALKINGEWLGTPVKSRGAIGWSLVHDKVLIDRILTNSAEEWKKFEYIVGGTPVLVRNGQVIEDFTPEQTLPSFLTVWHARTAVGIKANGDWVFVVVDRSASRLFGGMTIQELANFMLDLGCVDALNLDGGGSSTMVVEGKVVNEPCGIYAEAVSDAILIF